jgi:hypothetical protein
MARVYAQCRKHPSRRVDADRTRQHDWVRRHPHKAALCDRTRRPSCGAVRREPCAHRCMVHVRVPSQRDKRVDVQQRHREGSILVECSPHHLWRDWRRTCRHTDDRQSVVSLNPSGGQPSTGKLRDNGAERAVLPNGELARNRDHILVDVQGRPHVMMLAHHRISGHPLQRSSPTAVIPYSSTGLPASTTRPPGNRAKRFALTPTGSIPHDFQRIRGWCRTVVEPGTVVRDAQVADNDVCLARCSGSSAGVRAICLSIEFDLSGLHNLDL